MAQGGISLKSRLRDAAVRAMLDSAERVMIRKGYEAATMQEVAAGAGCATGTLYLHFARKEQLLQAVAGRRLAAMHAEGRRALEDELDPVEALRLAGAAILRYIDAHRGFFRMFFTAMPMRISFLRKRVGRSMLADHEQYLRVERRVIREAQKRGQVRRDFTPHQIQEFMAAVGFSLVEQFLFSRSPPPLRRQATMLWEFIARGIGAAAAPHGAAGAKNRRPA